MLHAAHVSNFLGEYDFARSCMSLVSVCACGAVGLCCAWALGLVSTVSVACCVCRLALLSEIKFVPFAHSLMCQLCVLSTAAFHQQPPKLLVLVPMRQL